MKSVKNTSFFPSFYSDIFIDNIYYASLVRSPQAHGRISAIELPTLPQGYHFFSAKNIPCDTCITVYNTKIPIFASETVSYIGEAVGIMCGKDMAETIALAQSVLVHIEPLAQEEHIAYEYHSSSLSSADETQNTKAEQISSTVASRAETSDTLDELITVENTYSIKPNQFIFSESDGALVSYAKHENKAHISVFSPSKWSSHVLFSVSRMLNMSPEYISVKQTKTSEGFSGNIWFSSVHACQTALASFLLGASVRLVLSSYENELYTQQEIEAHISYKTTVTKNGTIAHMGITLRIDGGAYCPFIQELTDRVLISSLGIYKPKQYTFDAQAVLSNTTPKTLCFDWGESHGFFAVEMHLQEIAERLEVLPLDIKKENAIPTEKDSISAILDYIVKASDYQRKYSAYHFLAQKRTNITDGHLKGIGLATAYQGSGFMGSSKSAPSYSMEMTLDTDGAVIIKTPAISSSVQLIWKKIVADMLGIEATAIYFEIEHTPIEIVLGPESLSSNSTILTQLVKKCCTLIQKQRFRNPLPIMVKQQYISRRKKMWSHEYFPEASYDSLSWGAAIVEVEVHPLSYDINVLNVWIVVDGGIILVEKEALHAIRKSLAKVALKVIPSTMSLNYTTHFLPSTKESKGIGELPYELIPAAYANAVSQAIYHTITHMPVDIQTAYDILKERYGS